MIICLLLAGRLPPLAAVFNLTELTHHRFHRHTTPPHPTPNSSTSSILYRTTHILIHAKQSRWQHLSAIDSHFAALPRR